MKTLFLIFSKFFCVYLLTFDQYKRKLCKSTWQSGAFSCSLPFCSGQTWVQLSKCYGHNNKRFDIFNNLGDKDSLLAKMKNY